MVLFSTRTRCARSSRCREVAPAGRSWEFLRPFAGPYSILLLDGEEHLRERRLLQKPFHGERMRAFAPLIADLARRELATLARARRSRWTRMRELTLQVILRASSAPPTTMPVSACAMRSRRRSRLCARCRRSSGWCSCGETSALTALGAGSGVAVERFDALLFELLARRTSRAGRGFGARVVARAARRAWEPAERPAAPRRARGAPCRWPRQLGRVTRVGVRAAGAASVRTDAAGRRGPGLPRRGRKRGSACPAAAHDRATAAAGTGSPRRTRAPGRGSGGRLPVARDAPRGPCGRTRRRFDRNGGSRTSTSERAALDSFRRRCAPVRGGAVRRDGDARGGSRRSGIGFARCVPPASVRGAACSSSSRTAAARSSSTSYGRSTRLLLVRIARVPNAQVRQWHPHRVVLHLPNMAELVADQIAVVYQPG